MTVSALTFPLLAMLLWGLAPILGKLGLVRLDPYTALTIRTVVIAFILVVYGLVTGKLGSMAQVDWKSAGFIAGEGILASLLGHLAYFYALKYGESSRVVPMIAAFPAVTWLAAIVIAGEKFAWNKLLGVIVILIGILIIKR